MSQTDLTAIQTAMTDLIQDATPIVIAVAIAGLALWGIPKLIGWVKRAVGR